MTSAAWQMLIRLAACVALSWVAWQWGGPVMLCISLVVWGLLLSKPLIELASDGRHALRALAWRREEGHYFAFRGMPVHVLEDDEQQCWLRVAQVRQIVGFTASDTTLAIAYPDDWRLLGRPPAPHLRDEALLVHLKKERSSQALRFAQWLERDVAYPARQRRMRRTRSVVE
jgi:hypothetical protein